VQPPPYPAPPPDGSLHGQSAPEAGPCRSQAGTFVPPRPAGQPTPVRETFAQPQVDATLFPDLETLSVPVASDTDPVVVSSLAKQFAVNLGFTHVAVAQVALAAGELASNCWRHGGGGHVEIHATEHGLELRVIDHGPGIPDLSQAEQDGVSRGRRHSPQTPIRDSLGAGLGSVRRLMDEVEVCTVPSVGTTVIARKRRDARPDGRLG
jgi:anti-sigma regulatory factor (Ser/Thr protein kinase)